MSEPAKAVFLSYASQDAETAQRLADGLRGAGVEVWFDRSELVGGDQWDAKIRAQISSCTLFVPLISANTQARLEGYFRLEWKLAAQRTHTMADEVTFLLPVLLDGTRDSEAKVPAEFRAVQWTKLPGGEATPAFCARVQRLLAGETSPASGASVHGAPRALPAADPRRLSRWWWLAPVFGMTMALALVLREKGREPAPPPAPSAAAPKPASPVPAPASDRGPAGVAAADENSVAVLAFANLSDDRENEYFSDGISEELLTVLQKVPGLKVSARTSSFFFKGREATAQEVGAKLGVANLVEGSVRRAGGQVRITARLSRAATGEQLWSESYTRDLKDIFAVQTELAQTILAQLQSRLGGAAGRAEIAAQVAAAEKGGTRNAEAHELYLQGKYFLRRATLADSMRATGLLQRAVELDPDFALGWAALSLAGVFRGGYGDSRQDFEEGYALAKRASDRAIALEPAIPAGWIARFDLQSSSEFDWLGARESLRRAQALAPDDPEVVFRVSSLAYTFGDLPRALELTRQAKAIDPVNTQIYIQDGYTFLALRRPAEAQEAFQHVVELSPNAAWSHAGVGLALIAAGKYGAADEAAARSTLEWPRLYVRAMALFGLKQVAESDRMLGELATRLGDIAAYQIACAHAFRGEKDHAFEWLERAYRQHDPGLSWSKQDFFLQSLHADPRWEAFMHKLGLADDQLKP